MPHIVKRDSYVDLAAKLYRTEENRVRNTLPNLIQILQADSRFKGLMARNLFTEQVVRRTEPGPQSLHAKQQGAVLHGLNWEVRDKINGEVWTDVHDTGIRAILELPTSQNGYGLRPSDRDMLAAVNAVADINAFHPIKEYLESIEWDGRRRLDKLFIKYLGAVDDAYSREAAKLTLVAAVARIYEPGHKFDYVPIIEGAQGLRKSTFIRILAGQWFGEMSQGFDNRSKAVESMQGHWILEIPELNQFSKAEIPSLKAFFSANEDTVRFPYEKRATTLKRKCVFIGSTNDAEYLRDHTGNRRYWPITCRTDRIDTDRLICKRDQIWSEAYAVYKSMREKTSDRALPLYLSDEAAAIAAKHQELKRYENDVDVSIGPIQEYLDGKAFETDEFNLVGRNKKLRQVVCGVQLWTEALGLAKEDYLKTRANQNLIAMAMQKVIGWEKSDHQEMIPGWGKQRVYRRTKP